MCYGGGKLVLTWYFSFVEGNNGYIVVTANGGMNQQRVAVSNDLTSCSFHDYSFATKFHSFVCICLCFRRVICIVFFTIFSCFKLVYSLKTGLQCCGYCTVAESNPCFCAVVLNATILLQKGLICSLPF